MSEHGCTITEPHAAHDYLGMEYGGRSIVQRWVGCPGVAPQYAGMVEFRASDLFAGMVRAYWSHEGCEDVTIVRQLWDGESSHQFEPEGYTYTTAAARAFAHDLPLILDELESRAAASTGSLEGKP